MLHVIFERLNFVCLKIFRFTAFEWQSNVIWPEPIVRCWIACRLPRTDRYIDRGYRLGNPTMESYRWVHLVCLEVLLFMFSVSIVALFRLFTFLPIWPRIAQWPHATITANIYLKLNDQSPNGGSFVLNFCNRIKRTEWESTASHKRNKANPIWQTWQTIPINAIIQNENIWIGISV